VWMRVRGGDWGEDDFSGEQGVCYSNHLFFAFLAFIS
jgi:hypothetical protein